MAVDKNRKSQFISLIEKSGFRTKKGNALSQKKCFIYLFDHAERCPINFKPYTACTVEQPATDVLSLRKDAVKSSQGFDLT